MSFAPIASERLDLRPLLASDAAALFSLLDDHEIARQTPNLPCPYGYDMAVRWIAESRPSLYAGEEFLFGAFTRTCASLAAVIKLALDPALPEAEIGYWVDARHRRRGIAGEAVRKVADFAFATLGLARLSAGVLDGNPASLRVLAKAGFRETRRGKIGERAASFHTLDATPAKGLPLYVAAVAMIDDYGRVLIAKRPAGKAMAGLWEFPGGKVEPGERPRAALARELSEELALEATLSDLWPFAMASHRYPKFQLLMPLLLCRRWSGAPQPREGQAIAWATANALARFPIPAADAPLVEELSPLLAP